MAKCISMDQVTFHKIRKHRERIMAIDYPDIVFVVVIFS